MSPPPAKKRRRRRMLLCFDALVDNLRFLVLAAAVPVSISSHIVYRALRFNSPLNFATIHRRNMTKALSIVSLRHVYDIKSGRVLEIPSVPLPLNIGGFFGKIRINFYTKALNSAFSPEILQFLAYLAPHMTTHTLKIDLFPFYRGVNRPLNKCLVVANKIVGLLRMYEKFNVLELSTIPPNALDRLFSTACFRNTTKIRLFHSLCHPYFDTISAWLHIPNPLPRYFNNMFRSCNCTVHRPRACFYFMSHLARSFRHGNYPNAFYLIALPTCTCFTLFMETYPFEKTVYNHPVTKCMVIENAGDMFYIITVTGPNSFIVRAPSHVQYVPLLNDIAAGLWQTMCPIHYDFEHQFGSKGEAALEIGGNGMDSCSKLLYLA